MPPKSTTTPSKTRAGAKAATEGTRKSSRTKGEAPEYERDEDPEAVVHSEGGTKKRAAPSSGNGKPASAKKTKATPPAKKGEKKTAAKDDDDDEEDAIKAIEIGDALPELTLKNENDEDVEVFKLAGEKGVVIFTYPKADTPGCTSQACLYRDAKDEFAEVGYVIYGLSKDKPEAQNKWIGKNSLTYPLLSDPSQKLLKALGCGGASIKRSHFIFEKGTGKLIDKAIGVKPKDDSVNALEFIANHHSASSEIDASKATGEPEAAPADEPASEEAGAEEVPAAAETDGDAPATEEEAPAAPAAEEASAETAVEA